MKMKSLGVLALTVMAGAMSSAFAQSAAPAMTDAEKEQAKKIYHLATLMTVNNFLTQHGYQVIQTNKLKLTYKAKFLTTERGFPLERGREHTFLDQQGHQRTYQPYLFREDVLKDAAELLGLC